MAVERLQPPLDRSHQFSRRALFQFKNAFEPITTTGGNIPDHDQDKPIMVNRRDVIKALNISAIMLAATGAPTLIYSAIMPDYTDEIKHLKQENSDNNEKLDKLNSSQSNKETTSLTGGTMLLFSAGLYQGAKYLRNIGSEETAKTPEGDF
jgi:hypothetical protein